MQKLIVILGPTASGKTDLSIQVAKALDGEVVSADSMQIYREMHIGTARPLPQEQGGIAHHLLGFVDPDAAYSVACYQRDALQAIDEILSRGKQPILAGGTGLYLNSILYDLDFTQTGPNQALRNELEEQYQENPALLHAKLAQLDPAAAQRIHPNDKKRLIRRLEILEDADGKRPYEFRKPQSRYQIQQIGITKPRETLYRDIERRVDAMFAQGLETEVREIFRKYGADIAAFSAIGYKEFLPYFAGKATLEEAAQLIKQNTRRFAKRQLTWFRREQQVRWFSTEDFAGKEALASAVISHIIKGAHDE